MWPNYYYLEARRLAAERTNEADAAALARLATLYRQAQLSSAREPSRALGALRRSIARLAEVVGRAALRVAHSLDECIPIDEDGMHSRATPLG